MICNNLTTEIFKFIWDNTPDKIKRDILYKKYEYGGLKLTKIENLINTVKAGWAKRYLDKNNKNPLKIFFDLKLKKNGGSTDLHY